MSKKTTYHIEIEGADELERKLASLERAAGTRIAKDAVGEGGGVIQFYAQKNALSTFSSRQTGALRNSIIVESRATDTGAEAEIGPHVIYGRIQEFGGTIRPVRAKRLHFVIDGQDVFARQVTLPARPYLRPAVDDHKDQILSVMAEVVNDGILQSVQRI